MENVVAPDWVNSVSTSQKRYGRGNGQLGDAAETNNYDPPQTDLTLPWEVRLETAIGHIDSAMVKAIAGTFR